MSILYRIENEETHHGMWYRYDGTFDPFIFRLTEGISKDLPMEFDERYGKDGVRWFSACDNREQMQSWFSSKDALELYEAGYRLYEFNVSTCIKEENQVLFPREAIVAKIEIPLDVMWDIHI